MDDDIKLAQLLLSCLMSHCMLDLHTN